MSGHITANGVFAWYTVYIFFLSLLCIMKDLTTYKFI